MTFISAWKKLRETPGVIAREDWLEGRIVVNFKDTPRLAFAPKNETTQKFGTVSLVRDTLTEVDLYSKDWKFIPKDEFFDK